MTAIPLSRAARPLAILAAVCIATSAVCFKLQFPTTGIDDANIFLVYARSVSAGEGFVFNPGGERVEGFTSLLWVLICTAAVASGAAPERLLLVVNVLLVALTMSCCLRSSVFRGSSNSAGISVPWACTFLILLLSDYRYVAWNTVTLMETALWGCLLTLSALLVADDAVDRRHARKLAALVALMIVTRPESLVWAPAVLVLFSIKTSITDRAAAVRLVAPAVLVYVLTAGSLTMFRWWYFGFPLPNTYYAKVSPSLAFSVREGATYVWSYVSSGPVPFACVLTLISSVYHLFRVRFRDTRTLALSGLAIAGLLLPVPTGGDHFGGFRFYQSVYPILLLALVNCLRFIVPRYVALPSERRTRHAILLVGSAVLAAFLLVVQIVDWLQFDQRMRLRMEFDIAELGRERGLNAEMLFGGLHPRPSIGTITVGGLKYAYRGEVIDLMGLNNTRMAHNGGDRIGLRSHAAFEKRTFYELNPTIVIPLVQYSADLSWLTRRIVFVDGVLKGLLDEHRFRNAYRLAEVRKSTPDGVIALAAWYEREFLNRVVRSNEFEVAVPVEP